MSTIAYGSMTNQRERAPDVSRSLGADKGVSSYLDAVAALVPAEVLSLHAVIVSLTTSTGEAGSNAATITEPGVLHGAFYALIVLSIALYLASRFMDRGDGVKLSWFDVARACIPPLAFVAWTMLQPLTAFDAMQLQFDILAEVTGAARTVGALFLAVALGIAATVLATLPADKPLPTAARVPGDAPTVPHGG